MPATDKQQNNTNQSDYKMRCFILKKAENRLVDTFLGSVSLSDFSLPYVFILFIISQMYMKTLIIALFNLFFLTLRFNFNVYGKVQSGDI